MKSHSLGFTCSCFGAALSFGASGASAQIQVPNPPSVSPAAPLVPLRNTLLPMTPILPTSPLTPGIESMPRMAPTPGVGAIPNGASTLGQAPAPRMAPMPGAVPRSVPGQVWRLSPRSEDSVSGRISIAPDGTLRFPISPAKTTQLVPLSDLTSPATPRPDTMVADGNFLYVLRGDTLVKIDKKTLKVVGSTTLPTANLSAAPLTTPRSSKSDQLPLTIEDMLKSLRKDTDPGVFIRPFPPTR